MNGHAFLARIKGGEKGGVRGWKERWENWAGGGKGFKRSLGVAGVVKKRCRKTVPAVEGFCSLKEEKKKKNFYSRNGNEGAREEERGGGGGGGGGRGSFMTLQPRNGKGGGSSGGKR